MKNKYIYVILVITILFSIILPFLFKNESESVNDTINIITSIIGSTTSLFTFIIAILLFHKFGIETPLLEKNTTIVFEFVEELKKCRFYVCGDTYFMMIPLHNPHELLINSNFPESSWCYEKKLIFSTKYYDELAKVFELANSPFMPKNISQKVEKLNCYIFTNNEIQDKSQYDQIIQVGENTNESVFGKFNAKDITLFEFLNLIEDVKVETINWISENSKYAPNLNI